MTRTGKSLVKHGLIAIVGALFGISLTAARPAGAEELRIGFIAPMTGPFAQVGKDMVNGFEMYMNEVNGDFAGATVKFILEDNQAKPPTALLKAEKLIRQDQVHMFIGGVLASTGYALAPISAREKVVYI
ncbi:MAG: ABC transporter substrate-binding protein, partial [Stellaceae bacterium]